MTAPAAPQAFTNVRILTDDDKEQLVVSPDAPLSPWPIAEETLRSDPGRFLWVLKPGAPPRPPTDEELASYAARRDDPSLAWLYDVAEATKAPPLPAPAAAPEPGRTACVRCGNGYADAAIDGEPLCAECANKQIGSDPALRGTHPRSATTDDPWTPVAAGPAPETSVNLPTEPLAPEDAPAPAEAPEPEPDATTVLHPGEALTALLPAQEAPTALLPAATDEEVQA